MEIQDRLPERFVFRVEKREGFRLILGFEAVLLPGDGVLRVEDFAAPEEDKPLSHTLPFVCGNVKQSGLPSLASSHRVDTQ